MKLIKTMLVGVLGTATLLPALPAWADTDTAPVAGMNCHRPTAPAGERARASKPLSIIASQIRSSGRRHSRNVCWTMSWYRPLRFSQVSNIPRPRSDRVKKRTYLMVRRVMVSEMSGSSDDSTP